MSGSKEMNLSRRKSERIEILQNLDIPCEHICIDGLIKDIKGSKVKFYIKQFNNPQVFTSTIL
jgi:hypothetical protein